MKIGLEHIKKGLYCEIVHEKGDQLREAFTNAAPEGTESPYQIYEGNFYEYKISDPDFALVGSSIVIPSKFNWNMGKIQPNTAVGRLKINIEKKISEKVWQITDYEIELEVLSVKTDYRSDYRLMLSQIAEQTIDLIYQSDVPVYQSVTPDFDKNPQSLYQKFAFIKSILDSEEFELAIYHILRNPNSRWDMSQQHQPVGRIKRFTRSNLREMTGSASVKLKDGHRLKDFGIEAVASKVQTFVKQDNPDTSENRFIKFALESFHAFIEKIQFAGKGSDRLFRESDELLSRLDNHLNHPFFHGIGRANNLLLNSPVLQRREGYRSILKIWVMFDLAASLTWKGGDDVYDAGKKDVAKLYEYWLFFELLKAVQENFEISENELKKLIVSADDGLNFNLKEGNELVLKGIFEGKARRLKMEFSYNKTFGSSGTEIGNQGSWTMQLRPDYTLSIWPAELQEKDAEREIAEKLNEIVHVHFDSKYKVKSGIDIDTLNKEAEKGAIDKSSGEMLFKREDLHKMHTYNDAIRRTYGSYILYPGLEDSKKVFKGFHEILPGLGAFAVRPNEENTGIFEVQKFITEIKDHLLNLNSQREHLAVKTYKVHRNEPGDALQEAAPIYLRNERILPQETMVIVGYVRSAEHLEWCLRNGLYNFRPDKDSPEITASFAQARFIVLREKGKKDKGGLYADHVFELSKGFKVYSKNEMVNLGCPANPRDYYLVYEIQPSEADEFKEKKFRYEELEEYKKIISKGNSRKNKGVSFVVTLEELINVSIQDE